MRLLRNIALDLWEKRLWPVAALLLAGLVAVPVVLGAGDPPAPVNAPVAVAPGDPAGAATPAQIALQQPNLPGARRRAGALRDPFARRRAPKPMSRAPLSGAAKGPDEDVLGAAPPLPGFDLPPLTAPAGSGKPAVKPAAEPAGDLVSVRDGRAGELAERNDVAARTPLPSVGDPFLVYLGNKPDGASAQFLVSSDAVPTGDGKCRPGPELCEEIVMQAGDTEFFDVTTPEGEVVQYQLDVVRVGRG